MKEVRAAVTGTWRAPYDCVLCAVPRANRRQASMNLTRHIFVSSRPGISRIRRGALLLVISTTRFLLPIPACSQTAPAVSDTPWHSAQEKSIEDQALGIL